MVYVDDLLLLQSTWRGRQDQRAPTATTRTTRTEGQPLVFLGRQIEDYNDHSALSMTKEYYTSLLSLYNIKENTNSLSTTGTKRPPITTGEPLSAEHSTYRTI
eukprot:2830529-Amphidinium_carterae.1